MFEKKMTRRIWNISELIVPKSDHGKPVRGKLQNEILRIPQAYVAIQDGKILDFGPMNTCPKEYFEFPEIDAKQKVVMPGFVDPHTHLVFAGQRAKEFALRLQGADYLTILAAGGGILETVRAVRNTSLDDLIQNTVFRMKE